MSGNRLFILLACTLLSIHAYSQPVQTLTTGVTGSRYDYCHAILNLVIDKSHKKFGPAKLEIHSNDLFINPPAARLIQLVANGELDVSCLGYNQQRKHKFHWVEPGIYMGILGLRILLIRSGQQSRFNHIDSLADLNIGIKGGFVSSWSDMHVLDFNGVNTHKTNNYTSLIAMLKVGRFDYISRGANEIWGEIKSLSATQADKELSAEQKIALYYPADHFLVTAFKNIHIGNRLDYGMAIAMQDGSLKKLFFKHLGPALEKANMGKRKLLHLVNPQPQPNIETHWWLKTPP